MPVMAPAPDLLPGDHLTIEVAFTTTPDDPAPAWTDISTYVDLGAGIRITTGRADEFAVPQAGSCAFTVDNSDGRFTPGNTASPYWPDVLIRKKLRVSYTDPGGGDTSYRFTGYIEEWPVEWPTGGDTYSAGQVSAVDRFKRLGAAANLQSIIGCEYLVDAPFAYFTLGEPTDSTTAGDTSRNGLAALATAQVGAGGTLTFGANTGPGTDGLPAPAFTPASVANGKYLAGTGTAAVGAGGTMECFMLTSAAAQQTCVRLADTAGSWVAISTTAAGKASATNYNAATLAADFTLTSAGSVNDGATHHLALTTSFAAGVATVTLLVDGASAASTTYAGDALPAYSVVNIGGTPTGACFTGTLAHVAAYTTELSAARLLVHTQAGTTGFAGERSDQRIARIARYAGIPTAEQSLEVGLSTSIAFVDTTGLAPLAAMQDVAATENGLLFIDGAGMLTFHARSHRYNTSASFIVDAADIDPGARFIVNDALLVNDVTASRAAGITFRVVNAASVTDYGTTAVALTLLTTSDLEVMDAATWKANQTADIQPRLPALTVDLLTSPDLHAYSAAVALTMYNGAMLLGVGSRITLTGLPAQAPAATADLFIEGWTETISTAGWQIAWNTSPAGQSVAWQLEMPEFSELDLTSRLSY